MVGYDEITVVFEIFLLGRHQELLLFSQEQPICLSEAQQTALNIYVACYFVVGRYGLVHDHVGVSLYEYLLVG